ncbi:hypothetical protein ACFL6I_13160 [candidate division KSB1 bacterium]
MEKDNLTKDLLEFLLLTGGISLILTAPALLVPAILIARHMEPSKNKKKLHRSVSYLKEQKYISITQKSGETHIRLTNKGKRKAVLYSLQSTLSNQLKKKNIWDKKWRIVIFDIETGRRKKRDALRRMLKRSGFEQLQKSTWIYPFDCKEEVDLTKDFFGIKDSECRLVLASDIGEDKQYKKKFNIV